MKSDYCGKAEKLEAKLSTCNNDNVDIKGLLDIGFDNLLKLDYYENVDIDKKREVISSMFPENCILKIVHFELSG